MSNIRKSDVPVVDLANAEDIDAAIVKTTTNIFRSRIVTALNTYVLGVAVVAGEKITGECRGELAKRHGLSGGQLSKTCTVADTLHTLGEEQDRLERFWGLHWTKNPAEHATFAEVVSGLTGEDGETRAKSLVTFYDVFGSPSTAYDVLKGRKFHEDDPNVATDDPADEQEDDLADEDSGKTPWQDRLAALVQQAKLEGATPAEIVKVVNDALK